MNINEKIRESNRIEGILREPTPDECAEFARFVNLERVTIGELERFVKVYQPNARIRDKPGMDVRVGHHLPPAGGPHVISALESILDDANSDDSDPWSVHLQYENLHPFMDGNGRSGRMLWYWMMGPSPQATLGFLHAFYYQTLNLVKL